MGCKTKKNEGEMECNVSLRSENILSVSVRVCVCVCPFFEKRSEISPARRKEAGR